jgi:hypothetical protein
MIGYKLFRKRKDGTYGPLFINKRLKLVPGTVYEAEDHPTKGFAHRPGWHVCSKPIAPHLRQGGDRVWCLVDFSRTATIDRPASQGGIWYLGSFMMIIREIKTPTAARAAAMRNAPVI